LPLATKNNEVRKAILDLKGMFDSDIITSIWEECLNAPDWDRPAIWLHGDLLPSNLLIQNGKLTSVIDFGLMGIGDPACDLIPAWSLFDADSREVFRQELQIDDNTWIRGKGWALAIALIIIPYYLSTNPVLVSVAKRIIGELSGERNNDKK
jgi:aminoglycoside phosphotransferase (APT) family kinase protein